MQSNFSTIVQRELKIASFDQIVINYDLIKITTFSNYIECKQVVMIWCHKNIRSILNLMLKS